MRVCWKPVGACCLVLLLVTTSHAENKLPGWQFQLSFPKELRAEPFSGRVVLYFSQTRPQPRERLSWFQPEILVGRDVTDWKPGETFVIDSHKPHDVTTCPKPIDQLNLAGWKVQAVARFNSWERNVGDGEGNGFSSTAVVPSEAAPFLRDADLAAAYETKLGRAIVEANAKDARSRAARILTTELPGLALARSL